MKAASVQAGSCCAIIYEGPTEHGLDSGVITLLDAQYEPLPPPTSKKPGPCGWPMVVLAIQGDTSGGPPTGPDL